jgi:ABC-2 type transport system permease protein
MFYVNVFLKTLRDNRAGMLGWGLGMAFLMFAGAAQFPLVIQGTGAERAKNIEEISKAFQAFSFMTGEITSIGTIGGYVTTRILGLVPTMLALWTLVVGVGLIRGEEEQGTLEVLLSAPWSRTRVLLEKTAALFVGMVVVAVLAVLGLWAGILAAGEQADAGALALVALNIAGLTGFWGYLGLLAGQFTDTRRKASGIVGGLLFASYLLNNVFGATPDLKGLTWLLPAHYYALSKPLAPGGIFEWGAWSVLVSLALTWVALSIPIFARRDIGPAFSPFGFGRGERAAPGRLSASLLGSVFGKALRDMIVPSLWWGLGIGAIGAVIVATTDQALVPMRQMARNAGWLAKLMGDLASNEAYLSVGLFSYLPVLLAVFAITQIGSWTGDEEEGRLEMLVSVPVPRWKILLARYAALVAGQVVILVLLGALVLLTSAATNVSLDAGRVVQALAAALPLGPVVAAFGLCVATWAPRPGIAVPVTIALVGATYFFETLAPLFDLPEAVLNLSIFHLYGKPLVEGIKWGGLLALSAAAVLFAAASLAGWERRDIAA